MQENQTPKTEKLERGLASLRRAQDVIRPYSKRRSMSAPLRRGEWVSSDGAFANGRTASKPNIDTENNA